MQTCKHCVYFFQHVKYEGIPSDGGECRLAPHPEEVLVLETYWCGQWSGGLGKKWIPANKPPLPESIK